jgi:hypothetical protein
MTEGDGPLRATPLVYQRFLRAALNLIDAGKSVTYGNLGAELGRAKQVVWKFVKRHPEVLEYVEEQVSRANAQFAGLVVRRHAMLGMQGSVPSADLFLKSQAGHYARSAAAEGFQVAPGAFQLNILVPRPDLPGLPAPSPGGVVTGPAPAASLIPRPIAPARPAIPTVAIR